MKHIIVSAVSRPLTIGKNNLREGIIEVALNIIAAFLPVRLGSKVRGNSGSVVFQGVAGAKQLLLFSIMVIIVDAGWLVEVVMAGLQDRNRL